MNTFARIPLTQFLSILGFSALLAADATVSRPATSSAERADEEETYRVINNFTFVGLGYSYRTYSGSPAGSGQGNEGTLTLSKEWVVANWSGGDSFGFQTAPSFQYEVIRYGDVPQSMQTMEIGGRVGMVLKVLGGDLAIAPFVDVAWQRDSVEGSPRVNGLGIEPGVGVGYRITDRFGLVLEYKYLQFADIVRLENAATNEWKIGAVVALTRRLGIEIGGVVDSRCPSSTGSSFSQRATAFGGYLAIRQSL